MTIEKPKTFQEYIERQDETKKEYLYQMEALLKEVLQDAKEKISWGMPTFYMEKNIIHFAAFKTHIGIYPGAKAIEVFKEDLQEYSTSKGAIRIPYQDPLPKKLIQMMHFGVIQIGKKRSNRLKNAIFSLQIR